MCALAHYLENAGIPTVVISLVRLHSEIIRPPRALFVPFELGRPLGDPNDISGQRDVVKSALGLLDLNGPDPVLVDYASDATSLYKAWQPPFIFPQPVGAATGAALLKEFEHILPAYEQAQLARGRTSFGNAGRSPETVLAVICDVLKGSASTDKRHRSKSIRFAVDDLKTLYFEAACLGASSVDSADLGEWFWRSTVAGQAIAGLRAKFSQSDDKALRLIANFMVPGEWVDKLAL